MNKPIAQNLGDLKKQGYTSKSLKEELRRNLISALQQGTQIFDGILGYNETVIPELQTAILAGHHINFLGLRGQAKTSMARKMIHLLDEWMPIIKGSEINDDPFKPLSRFGIDVLAEMGDETPIEWVHRSDRYIEKLATPDVTVADLIGDIDPIKAANLRVGYQDERAIHFGLIPRSNRCIFVINELPDLQPRIQVALFNILQEGDIQIRGFKLRLPLDVQFVFTANPEDYTNRGSIVTPLKDRIGSQILTHYPADVALAATISAQEAKLTEEQKKCIHIPQSMKMMMENIAFIARESEFVDQKSGVSARVGIAVLESVVSAAERRMILSGDAETTLRVSDLYAAVQAVNGKLEMVYEGELEGPYNVAINLILESIKLEFDKVFQTSRKKGGKDMFTATVDWFSDGNTLQVEGNLSNAEYHQTMLSLGTLKETISAHKIDLPLDFAIELALHGLAAHSRLSKIPLSTGFSFKDLLSSMMDLPENDENEEDDTYFQ
ncbi:MAG: magnesium chelatase [Bacteroidia bacterium]|nr:magnesium chelatase [Bacteroidia bacterium]